MKFYIKTFKEWYKLARPSKKYFFYIFFLIVMTQVCLLLAPIFTAKVTVSITSGKYTNTIIYLCVVFALLLIRETFWHAEYLAYSGSIKQIYKPLNYSFMDKTIGAKSSNFNTISKPQILNMLHTDNFTVAEFNEKLALASARFVMTIVNVIVIFTVNVYAGLIVLIADVLDCIFLAWASNRRQRWHKLTRVTHDKQFEKFSEILDAREAIKDFGEEKRLKDELGNIVDDYIKQLKKRDYWESMYENWYTAFYEFLILIATIISVILVAHNGLTLETYFVVVSYVATGISNTKSMFGIIKTFDNTAVATARVKTVLNFVEREKVKVGKNTLTDVLGSLCFSKVNYKKDDEGNPALKNFDILFNQNQTCLLLGSRSCGKRTIFNLLRRAIEPEKGEITLSGVNLYDFTSKAYLRLFSYVTTHPTFFKGSIMRNLSLQEKNKKVIYQVCKEVGIYDYITSLKKKFNTDISLLPYDKLYLIALARALLTGSELLVVYEFPDALTEKEKMTIKNLLRNMHGTRTILIFSAKDYCQDICDKIVTIEKGSVSNITYNNLNKVDFI